MGRRREQGSTAVRPVRPNWTDIRQEGDRVVLSCRPCNLVDDERVERLSAVIAGIVRNGASELEIDLRAVGFADTKLVAVLVVAAKLARQCRVELIIRPSAQLHRVLHICRLDTILNVA